MHDPTQKNRQGPDTGPRESFMLVSQKRKAAVLRTDPTEYRSVVFYHGDAQRKTTEAVQSELQETRFGPMGKNIETQIVNAADFTWYDAEVGTGWRCCSGSRVIAVS